MPEATSENGKPKMVPLGHLLKVLALGERIKSASTQKAVRLLLLYATLSKIL
jgi:hypothetical protein